jgi:5-methylcytosine-specific restriction endonuclease McrA
MNSDLLPLPHPDSQEFLNLGYGVEHRVIYAFVYGLRQLPPTMVEIRQNSAAVQGASHSQTDRRVRELYAHFDLAPMSVDGRHVYELRGMWAEARPVRKAISGKTRAIVFRHQRCAQCGQTVADDGVTLQVDHKWPLHLGGSDEIENLQALCIPCNHGKKDFYEDFNGFRGEIIQASEYLEPHKRIGELMKAFTAHGKSTPGILIEMVASAQQYQDDWQKRARELRALDWKFTIGRHKENGRVHSTYTLDKWQPWPDGKISAAVKRAETVKKAEKAAKKSSEA